MPSKGINWLCAFLSAAVAILAGWQYYSTKSLTTAMAAWPHTDGAIKSFEMQWHSAVKGGDYYEPTLSYQFNCQGNLCGGTEISIPPPGHLSQAESQIYKERYPVGRKVTVYYNPAMPAQCFLERSSPENVDHLLAITVFFGLAAIVAASLPGRN